MEDNLIEQITYLQKRIFQLILDIYDSKLEEKYKDLLLGQACSIVECLPAEAFSLTFKWGLVSNIEGEFLNFIRIGEKYG